MNDPATDLPHSAKLLYELLSQPADNTDTTASPALTVDYADVQALVATGLIEIKRPGE